MSTPSTKSLNKKAAALEAASARKTHDRILSGEHAAALEEQLDDLAEQVEEGSVSRAESAGLLRQIKSAINAEKSLRKFHAGTSAWLRVPATGFAWGALWSVLALIAIPLTTFFGGHLLAALIVEFLFLGLPAATVATLRHLRNNFRGFGVSARPAALAMGFGPGGMLVLLLLAGLTWRNPLIVLAVGFYVGVEALRNVLGFAFLCLTQNPAFAARRVKADVEAMEDSMRQSGHIKEEALEMIRARGASAVGASAHALLAAALGVAAPLALYWGVPQAMRHHLATASPVALSRVDASALSLSNPASARAAADALQARAKQTVAAAQAAGYAPTPDWLESSVLRAGLPAGVSNQWTEGSAGAFIGTAGANQLIALRAQPVFLDGAWTPGGFYIAEARSSDKIVANVYADSGMWFVPFYRDAACKVPTMDAVAVDREWKAFLRPDALKSHPMTDSETVGCVGVPVAVRAKTPFEWPASISGYRALAVMQVPLTLALHVTNWTDQPQASAADAKGARAKTDRFIDTRVWRFFEGTIPFYMPSVGRSDD
ncbi:hypothetical protein LA345_13085 [Burkholderia vietnamiensis]|uniref:Uncharacterized protein n=1 Tax=Burkholderia vietnamiensis (strain G4 / LMG 22486) TaxID=269482 RepID=A4JFN3_BURVG|nr:hypothetical protein Bcep1808_2084 [Burkholderia vietnamiensis G4]MCB4344847.1 hypothetical protein [Burkholderia vietnamiensis]